MNFWKRYPGDYGRDTAHLSLSEHGAYGLLLDHYYSTEAPLPADFAALYRLCRAFEKAEQAAVRSVAEAYFPIGEDGLRHNARADRQIPEDQRAIETARVNGKKGGRPKKETQPDTETKPKNNPAGFDSVTQQEPSGKAHQTPDLKQEQKLTPSALCISAVAETPACLNSKREQREAEVAREAIRAYNAALAKPIGLLPAVRETVGFDRRRQQVRRVLKLASEICQAEFGGKTITPEFWAAYFGMCADDPFLSGRQGGGPGHENWLPDFDYLTTPKAMLRLYDRTSEEVA